MCRKGNLFNNQTAWVTSRRKALEMPHRMTLLADRATSSPASEGKAPGKTPNRMTMKQEDRCNKMRYEEDCREKERN